MNKHNYATITVVTSHSLAVKSALIYGDIPLPPLSSPPSPP